MRDLRRPLRYTFHHPHIDAIGEASLLRELRSTERVLEGQLGLYAPLFRAPYGAAFDANKADLARAGEEATLDKVTAHEQEAWSAAHRWCRAWALKSI